MKSLSLLSNEELIQMTRFQYGVVMNLRLQHKDRRNKEYKEAMDLQEEIHNELEYRNIDLYGLCECCLPQTTDSKKES